MPSTTDRLRTQLAKCRESSNPTDRFNTVVLGLPPLWRAQQEIGRALADPTVRRVVVKSGHLTGKSRVGGIAAYAWATMHKNSGVIIRGPTLDQVKNACWAEVVTARNACPLLRGVGDVTQSPAELRYGMKWKLRGIGGTNVGESLQGFHPTGPVLIINDESSGLNDTEADQALDTLKPVKRLDLSNPLRPVGLFFNLCERAIDDPSIRLITIPSTSSPDIHLDHSPRGLADAGWLRNMELEYGRDSQTWRVRVLAEFPEGSDDQLIPPAWLNLCGHARHVPGGHRRLAMDLAGGNGGDQTTWLVRDDNGLLQFQASRTTPLYQAAQFARQLADYWGIEPRHVSYDAAGLGSDFALNLRLAGLNGCQAFVGGRTSKNKRSDRHRTAAHVAMRRRLNPERPNADGSPRPIFAIPDRVFLDGFRRECRELTFTSLENDGIALRLADEVKAALGYSPDLSATLAQSFFFN